MTTIQFDRQGLIPVYVGLDQKKSFNIEIPAFNRGRRKDILFFTQELSTLLNAGVPVDRALQITAEHRLGSLEHRVMRIRRLDRRRWA